MENDGEFFSSLVGTWQVKNKIVRAYYNTPSNGKRIWAASNSFYNSNNAKLIFTGVVVLVSLLNFSCHHPVGSKWYRACHKSLLFLKPLVLSWWSSNSRILEVQNDEFWKHTDG